MQQRMDTDEGLNWICSQFQVVLTGQTKAAEEQLDQASAVPGFAPGLTRLVLSPSVPLDYRRMASVILKQYINAHWHPLSEKFTLPAASDEDKEVVRTQILNGLSDPTREVRVVVSHVVARLAFFDYPDQWPGLMDQLMGALQSGDSNVIHGVLRTLSEFADDMRSQQMPTVIPTLFPQLFAIYSNANFTERDKTRAVSIVNSCLKSMYSIIKEFPKDLITNMLGPLLMDWFQTFPTVITASVSPTSDCGLQIEVMRMLKILVVMYNKYLTGLVEPVLPAVWAVITQGVDLYSQAMMSDKVPAAQASDGDVLGFEFYMESVFEFAESIFHRVRYREALRTPDASGSSPLDQLFEAMITYLQLTDDQIELWENDPDLYVQDENEDVVKNYSVRVAADDCLATCVMDEIVGYGFIEVTTVSCVKAAMRNMAKADSLRGSGNPDWWRLMEATFLMLGRVSSDIDSLIEYGMLQFDASGLFQILLSILQDNQSHRFLVGRALWLAARVANLVPENLSVPLLHAVVAGISSPVLPIRVAAVEGITYLVSAVPKQVITPLVADLVQGVIGVASAWPTQPCVCLVLDALPALLEVNAEAITALEGTLTPFVIACWLRYPGSHMVGPCVMDIIDIMAGIQGYYDSLATRLVPAVLSIIAQPEQFAELPGFVSASLDLLLPIVEQAPEPFPAAILDSIFPAVMNFALSTNDGSYMQSASGFLRYVIHRDSPGIVAKGLLPTVMQFIAKLLSSASEEAAAFVGNVVVNLMKKVGGELGNTLTEMLTAIAQRLCSANLAFFVQSLVIVFAHISLTQGVDSVIDFLNNTPNPNGTGSCLAPFFEKWTMHERSFRGSYNLRVGVASMIKFLTPPHPTIANLQVPGRILDPDGVIMTRGKRTQHGENWTAVPFPVKAFELLLQHLRDEIENRQFGQYEVSDSDSDIDEDAAVGKMMYLSEAAHLGLDMQPAGQEDADVKDDPVNQIDVGDYICSYMQSFAQQDANGFSAIASQLSEGDQNLLRAVLAGSALPPLPQAKSVGAAIAAAHNISA